MRTESDRRGLCSGRHSPPKSFRSNVVVARVQQQQKQKHQRSSSSSISMEDKQTKRSKSRVTCAMNRASERVDDGRSPVVHLCVLVLCCMAPPRGFNVSHKHQLFVTCHICILRRRRVPPSEIRFGHERRETSRCCNEWHTWQSAHGGGSDHDGGVVDAGDE